MLKTKVKSLLVMSSIVLTGLMASAHAAIDKDLTAEEIQAIAKEAYIYAYPMVDHYRVTHSYFADAEHNEFKAPFNTLGNVTRVATPEDRTVQGPNSDTPYGWLGLDLRAEPLVLTLPKIPESRYYSVQFIDMYTHNVAYEGSRETGNGGSTILVTTESWSGEVPKGVDQVVRFETDFALAIYRTQLFDINDLDNVIAIQKLYDVKTLSEYTGGKSPKAAPKVDFIAPATSEEIQKSLAVFQQLNFLLQFAPVHKTEVELRARMASIGLEAGEAFDPANLTPEQLGAFTAGIKDAWGHFMEIKAAVSRGEVSSGDAFGTREFLQNNYGFRMAAAVLGIWGNSEAEAYYPAYYVDDKGQPLNGSNNYELYFEKGQLPPVNSFWSLTLYEMPGMFLYANELDRYLLNSVMEDNFIRDKKGGIRLYIQNENPGKDKEANWLPIPQSSIQLIMRLYWPQESALNGEWTQPALKNVSK
jgi:hypothetical protein